MLAKIFIGDKCKKKYECIGIAFCSKILKANPQLTNSTKEETFLLMFVNGFTLSFSMVIRFPACK